MAGSHEPSHPVECRSEVVTVLIAGGSGVNADPNSYPGIRGPGRLRETALSVDRCLQGLKRIGKCGVEGVAHGLEHHAVVSGDCVTDDLVVQRQGGAHCFRPPFP